MAPSRASHRRSRSKAGSATNNEKTRVKEERHVPVGAVLSSSAAGRLPFEILVDIFTRVMLAPPDFHIEESVSTKGKGKGKDAERGVTPTWSLLLLSKSLRSALEGQFYSRVSLTCTRSLQCFARTLKDRPDLSRRVKALWIAPISVESDFILALKPPAEGITAVPTQSNQPLSDIRQILRSCRSLRHAALDGCLCTLKAANSFGSNCQPLSLVSINPYSFLGGFSSPMFRKVRRLEMCDTSLASEEVEQVRSLPDLCRFIWTSPREYSDAKRDVTAMLRILTPRVAPSHLQLSIGGVSQFQDSESLAAASSPAAEQPFPVKAQTHQHLLSVTIRTGQTRSAELAASLKAAVEEHSQKLAAHTAQLLVEEKSEEDDQGEQEDLAETFSSALTLDSTRNLPSLQSRAGQLPYIDSAAHTSSILHPSTGIVLETGTFAAWPFSSKQDDVDDDSDDDGDEEVIIDEWEYLRDLICGSGSDVALEDYKRRSKERKKKLRNDMGQSSPDADEDEEQDQDHRVVPGMALRRLWIEWCQKVENGQLEVTKSEFQAGPRRM